MLQLTALLYRPRYDTFRLVTLEAMACGLLVPVSCAASVSELLNDVVDSFLLQEPGDAEALAGQLAQLSEDEGLRNSLAENARKTAQQDSWDRVAAPILAVYRQAME